MTGRFELAKPFFRRETTTQHIGQIAGSNNIVFYAGAGVTIDRSGLSWYRMVDELLRQHVLDADTRKVFIEDYGPLYAASAAHQHFRDAADDLDDSEADVRQRMADVLRVALYSPAGWGHGQLAASIAESAILWNRRRKSKVGSDQPCIVTTNYDDYLMGELVKIRQREPRRSRKKFSQPFIVFPTTEDPLISTSAEIAAWVTSVGSPVDIGVACVHLHGRIPRSAIRSDRDFTRFPVISETDYFLTSGSSEAALRALLVQRNLLIVGASLNDPPLVKALEATRDRASETGMRRWALITTAQMNSTVRDIGRRSGYEDLVESRLRSLGVIPIFVDYYMQLAQFFRELTVARLMTDPSKYGNEGSRSYYDRLDFWWSNGLGANGSRGKLRKEKIHHHFLEEHILPEVRRALNAPNEEAFKLEAWIRWDPANTRTLRLWASTTGIWTDIDSMRSVNVSENPEYLVVQAFRSGTALLRPTESQSEFVRWKSYLVAPYWLETDDQKFLAGVMLLASDRRIADCSFGGRSRRRIAECLTLLQGAGSWMADS